MRKIWVRGGALKTALAHVFNKYPEASGSITVDADGQHVLSDILKVAEVAKDDFGKLYLGSREFDGAVPFRSKLGNFVTRYLFSIINGKSVNDTQTGLRVVSRSFIPLLLKIKDNGYEFELEMLQQAIKNRIEIVEVKIRTIYEDNNSSSHFKPLADSIKIYKVLFRYSLASFASFVFDYILFLGFFKLFNNIFVATYCARFIAIFLNFFLVKKMVFVSGKKFKETFPRYLFLVIINPLFSSGIVMLLSKTFFVPVYIAKIIAESILFVFNFTVQKKIIFNK